MRFWIVLVLILGHAAPARATCMLRSWSSPQLVAHPLRGVVFAYTDGYTDEGNTHTARWSQGSGEIRMTKLSSSITRVDYVGWPGSILEVDGRAYSLATSASLAIPSVNSVDRSRGRWSCSSYDNLDIVFDAPAAALRATWHHGDSIETYWVVSDSNVYELGKVNCGGTTLPPEELDDGGTLVLTAVLADGSEHLVSTVSIGTLPFVGAFATNSSTVSSPFGPHADEDIPWAALIASFVLVVLAFRAHRVPTAHVDFPTARARHAREDSPARVSVARLP